MRLEDFRDIADEKTESLVMTPELHRRILYNCQKKKPVSRSVWIAAAACFVIMVISGVALVHHMDVSGGDGMIATARLAQGELTDNTTSEAHIAVGAMSKQPVADIKALPMPVEIGEYSEGYAPARNEEGLWGYVDSDGEWVIAPQYAEVSPVIATPVEDVTEPPLTVTPEFAPVILIAVPLTEETAPPVTATLAFFTVEGSVVAVHIAVPESVACTVPPLTVAEESNPTRLIARPFAVITEPESRLPICRPRMVITWISEFRKA